MAVVGEIRQNPGGRRLLVLGYYPDHPAGPRGRLWWCLQLNGQTCGARFSVPEQDLDAWHRIGTLPPDEYAGPVR